MRNLVMSSVCVVVLAVGGAIKAVDAVMAGKVQNAFAAVRPPGLVLCSSCVLFSSDGSHRQSSIQSGCFARRKVRSDWKEASEEEP